MMINTKGPYLGGSKLIELAAAVEHAKVPELITLSATMAY